MPLVFFFFFLFFTIDLRLTLWDMLIHTSWEIITQIISREEAIKKYESGGICVHLLVLRCK